METCDGLREGFVSLHVELSVRMFVTPSMPDGADSGASCESRGADLTRKKGAVLLNSFIIF